MFVTTKLFMFFLVEVMHSVQAVGRKLLHLHVDVTTRYRCCNSAYSDPGRAR
jgi:hypothetical protein